MTKKELNKFLKTLLKQLTKVTALTIAKTGVKTNSQLINSLEYKTTKDGFELIANDYFNYVDKGRKPFEDKVPIQSLIKWIQRYGIQPLPNMSINQLAFAIQTSIYKHGIVGKNYSAKVENNIANLSEEKIADYLENQIADDIVESLSI
jgi:hypothetical protein